MHDERRMIKNDKTDNQCRLFVICCSEPVIKLVEQMAIKFYAFNFILYIKTW